MFDQSYSFVITGFQVGCLNVWITTSQVTDITIFCQESVDVTVRIMFLFPSVVDVKLSIYMCATSSKIKVLGMCVAMQEQSIKLQSKQVHCASNCQSSLYIQSLITDQASFYYDGIIRIEESAAGTYALQNNKNILLSSAASVISIPNIEVLNHDVQCYHGSAVGRFDQEQIQYMQSRGLSEFVIKQLLIQAFFANILQGYEKREFILQKIYEKI